MGRRKQALPAALLRARKRFDAWRKRHRPRAPLAQELWDEAVALGREHGQHRTARALGLDYGSLGRRMKSARAAKGENDRGPGSFVEMFGPLGQECSIEWEDTDGAKMRICLRGAAVPDLGSLSRDFWRGGA
jgi:hypothetical protein